MADSSCHASIVAQCVSKAEPSHTNMKLSIFRLLAHKIIMYFYICFFSVIIICVDYCKRLVENFFCCQNCMTGSPRFCTSVRNRKSLRNIFHILERICHFCDLLDSFSDHFTELLLNILADNENNFVKTCLQSITNRIIHDDFTFWTYRCKLLDPLSETGSHSRSHDNKCCFFHFHFFLSVFISSYDTICIYKLQLKISLSFRNFVHKIPNHLF